MDIFVRHPVLFDELWERSQVMDLNGVNVRVCSIDDLITMKQQSGRHKDLADMEQLAKIKSYEKDRTDQ